MASPYAYLKDPVTGRFIDKTEDPDMAAWAASVTNPGEYVKRYIKLTIEWCDLWEILPKLAALDPVAWARWYEIKDETLYFEPFWDTYKQAGWHNDVTTHEKALRELKGLIHLLTREGRLFGFLGNQFTRKVRWVQTFGAGLSAETIIEVKIQERWQRKGSLPKIEAARRAIHEAAVIKRAQEEGVYGFFENRNTNRAAWKQVGAADKDEYDRIVEETREAEEAERKEWEDEFWTMHAEATKEYVEISIPAFDDIVRLPGIITSSKEEEKQRKKQQYEHMLHSPIPKTAQKLQRVAKCIDDVEDYMSTAAAAGYLASRAAAKMSPYLAKKLGAKLIPGLGWFLLATDVLNLGTGLFSAASNPMGAKRLLESARHLTRRRGLAKLKSAERVKRWRPHVGTLMEALQASEDATGYGIRLGTAMGCISEVFWGLEQYVTGKTKEIRIKQAKEVPGTLEQKASKTLGRGEEILHMARGVGPPIYLSLMLGAAMAGKYLQTHSIHEEWDLVYEAVKHERLLYEPPTNPITREVLAEMGYDPDEEVGYLGIEGPVMPLVEEVGTISTIDPAQTIVDALTELKDDWKSYFFNLEFDDFTDSFIGLLAYPDGGLVYHRTGDIDMLMLSAKMQVIPPLGTSTEALSVYCDMIRQHITTHERWPKKYKVERMAKSAFGNFDTVCPPTIKFQG